MKNSITRGFSKAFHHDLLLTFHQALRGLTGTQQLAGASSVFKPYEIRNSHIKLVICLALLLATIYPTFVKNSFATDAFAAKIPKPEGKIVLTITGNVSKSNSEEGVALDLAMIESLPTVTFSTLTPWTEGMTEWTGVRLNEFLDYVGAGSHEFHVKALDGYEVDFEKVDLDEHPIIMAYKQDGEYMSVRNLGPLWIMFPFTDYPELDIQFNRSLSVWQVVEMEIH